MRKYYCDLCGKETKKYNLVVIGLGYFQEPNIDTADFNGVFTDDSNLTHRIKKEVCVECKPRARDIMIKSFTVFKEIFECNGEIKQ